MIVWDHRVRGGKARGIDDPSSLMLAGKETAPCRPADGVSVAVATECLPDEVVSFGVAVLANAGGSVPVDIENPSTTARTKSITSGVVPRTEVRTQTGCDLLKASSVGPG